MVKLSTRRRDLMILSLIAIIILWYVYRTGTSTQLIDCFHYRVRFERACLEERRLGLLEIRSVSDHLDR